MDAGAFLAWTHFTHLQHTSWGESSVNESMSLCKTDSAGAAVRVISQ